MKIEKILQNLSQPPQKSGKNLQGRALYREGDGFFEASPTPDSPPPNPTLKQPPAI
jgi:hypothetical protein